MQTRCVDGRVMRHDPQPDDPYLETDIGKCPGCCECDPDNFPTEEDAEEERRNNGQFGVGS
jgi:hypothetical protein